MKHSDRRHLAAILKEFSRGGTLGRSDVSALFFLLRGDAAAGTVLRDVGDCIAHETRDRGLAHRYLRKLVTDMHAGFTGGGVFEVRTVYPIEQLLEETADLLAEMRVPHDRQKLLDGADALVPVLADILDGIKIEIAKPVVEVTFRADPGAPVVSIFFPEGVSGVVNIPPGGMVGIATALLREAPWPPPGRDLA